MKLLLDENLPVKLKNLFSSKHQIKTVNDMGWNGKKNGELLLFSVPPAKTADSPPASRADGWVCRPHGDRNRFDALVTMDKNLAYQQNIERFDLTIFILNALDNKISTLKPFI